MDYVLFKNSYVKVIKLFAVSVMFGILLCTNITFAADDAAVDFLPIGKDWVVKMGFGDQLPLPMGFSWNFAYIDQSVNLTDLRLKISPEDQFAPIIGLLLGEDGRGLGVKKDATCSVYIESMASNFKFDVWLLPILNVYGIVGYIEGDSGISGKTEVSPEGLANPNIAGLLGIFGGDLTGMSDTIGVPIDHLNFYIPLSGYTYGYGATLAGGYPVSLGPISAFFVALDANYLMAELDIADSTIKTYTFTPRLGVNGTLFGFQGAVYVGTMWMSLTSNMKGWVNYSGIEMQYDAVEEQGEEWNYLGGVRLDITQHFKLTFEIGTGGDRDHYIGSAEYRF